MKTFSLVFVNTLLDFEYKMQEEQDPDAQGWFQQYFAALLADICRADDASLITFVKDELQLGAPAVFVMEILQDYRPLVYEQLEKIMDANQVEVFDLEETFQ